MAMASAAEVAANWAAGLSNASQKITAGIQRVSENPAAKAAAAAGLWQQRVSDSRAQEKYVRGLNRTSLQSWKDATIKKGVSRIAQGAREAQPKMQAFMQEFLPHVAQVQAQVNSIPKGDLAASRARMLANMDGMAAFRRS